MDREEHDIWVLARLEELDYQLLRIEDGLDSYDRERDKILLTTIRAQVLGWIAFKDCDVCGD